MGAWEELVHRIKNPTGRGRDRHRRQVRLLRGLLQEPQRGAHPRRLRQRRARGAALGRGGGAGEGQRGRASWPAWTASWCRAASARAAPAAWWRRPSTRGARARPTSGSATASSGRSPSTRATCAAWPAPTPPRWTPDAEHKVIYKLQDLLGVEDMGGTMRLGSYTCQLAPGSRAARDLRRHRDPRAPPPPLRVQQGVRVLPDPGRASAITGKTPDGKFVEIAEIPDHPWYVAVQFHPEFKSQAARAAPALRRLRARQPREPRRRAGARAAGRDVPVAPLKWPRHRLGPPAPRRRRPLFLIAGPCVIESPTPPGPGRGTAQGDHGRARHPARLQGQLRQGQPLEPRLLPRPGPGARPRDPGRRARRRHGVPILTDVHEVAQVERGGAGGGRAADPGLPVPPDRPRAGGGAHAARIVNIKKGQFMAPWDMKGVIEKAASTGNRKLMVTERGFSFGYNNLVVDMRSFPALRSFGYPGDLRRHPQRAAARAAWATARAATRTSSTRSARRAWPRASTASSWRCTRTRPARCPTGRTRTACRSCTKLLQRLLRVHAAPAA